MRDQFGRPFAGATGIACRRQPQLARLLAVLLAFDNEDGLLLGDGLKQLRQPIRHLTNTVQLVCPATLAVRLALPEGLRIELDLLIEQDVLLVGIIIGRDDLRRIALARGLRLAAGALLCMAGVLPQPFVPECRDDGALCAAGPALEYRTLVAILDVERGFLVVVRRAAGRVGGEVLEPKVFLVVVDIHRDR